MFWFIGVASLSLILTVLSIDPAQLENLNQSITSNHWKMLSWSSLSLAFSIFLLRHYLFSQTSFNSKWRPAKTQKRFTHNKPASVNPTKFSTRYLANNLNLIVKHGITSVIVIFLLLSVIFNGLHQRIKVIEDSPKNKLYVAATVTPIGLSDKRLELGKRPNTSISESNLKHIYRVEQSYRQLVKLSNINYYDAVNSNHLSRYKNEGATTIVKEIDITNPFSNDLKPLKPELKVEELEQLPENMTVLLRVRGKDFDWLNQLSPNKTVRLPLVLTPIDVKKSLNNSEFDEYRWLSSRHAVAKASLISDDSLTDRHDIVQVDKDYLSLVQKINQFRFELREHFLKLIEQQHLSYTNHINNISNKNDSNEFKDLNDSLAVTLSLLTGDRSLISKELTATYRFAGISHLLAISGTHVLFLAMLSAAATSFFVTKFTPNIFSFIPRWQISFVVAVVVAFGYAFFAGFDVPAIRTAMMLLIVGVFRFLLVSVSVYKLLLGLAIVMAWQDIVVLWQAGFWLSFIAVGVLAIYSQRWQKNNKLNLDSNHTISNRNEIKHHESKLSKSKLSKSTLTKPKQLALNQIESNKNNAAIATNIQSGLINLKHNLIELAKLQLWVSMALLPLSLWLFGEVSLWGFVVNIFAIGLFGWVIVPLNLLAGLIYVISPTLAGYLWRFISCVLKYFHEFLFWLQITTDSSGWLYSKMTISMMALLLVMILPFILPKGTLNKLLSIPAFVLVLYITFSDFENSAKASGNNINNPQTLSIKPLMIHSAEHSATLIHSKTTNWLLLSAYPKRYQSKYSSPVDEKLDKLSQSLYKQLKLNNVNNLTGVIVQTSTPEMSQVVAKLRKLMVISNYWQAGLSSQFKLIETNMKSSRLTAQSCKAGKSWQVNEIDSKTIENLESINDKQTHYMLTAVTGWPIGENVSDCAIQIDNNADILIDSLDGNIKRLEVSSLVNNPVSNSVNNSVNNSAIIYTSAEPRIGKLWQLLCEPQNSSVYKMNISSFNNQHWITTQQSVIDNHVIDTMQPRTWHIMRGDRGEINSKLLDAHLHWQQNQ